MTVVVLDFASVKTHVAQFYRNWKLFRGQWLELWVVSCAAPANAWLREDNVLDKRNHHCLFCPVEVGFGSFAVVWRVKQEPRVKTLQGDDYKHYVSPQHKELSSRTCQLWHGLPQKMVDSSPLDLLKQRPWLFGVEVLVVD